jgi:hypothetical protein
MKEFYVRVTKTVGAIVRVVAEDTDTHFDEIEACLAAEDMLENGEVDTDPCSADAETIEEYSLGEIVQPEDVNPNLKYQTVEY